MIKRSAEAGWRPSTGEISPGSSTLRRDSRCCRTSSTTTRPYQEAISDGGPVASHPPQAPQTSWRSSTSHRARIAYLVLEAGGGALWRTKGRPAHGPPGGDFRTLEPVASALRPRSRSWHPATATSSLPTSSFTRTAPQSWPTSGWPKMAGSMRSSPTGHVMGTA